MIFTKIIQLMKMNLQLFLEYWMDANCISPDCPFDLDGVPGVNMVDYAIFAEHWGETRVVINEFMAFNTDSYIDPNGEHEDWIELYNPGSKPIDISGMYLTDDLGNLNKWRIPDGTIIGPKDFLFYWADEDEEQGADHLNFKLDKDGEAIALADPNGESIIDSIIFGPQDSDYSYGRYPDAGPNWYQMIRATKLLPNIVGMSSPPKFSIPGSAFSGSISLKLSHENPDAIIHYTTDGSFATGSSPVYTSPITINQTSWIHAMAKEPNLLYSLGSHELYFKLHSDVQDFTSNLPIVIIDTLGNDIDSEDRTFQKVAAAFIDTNKDGQADIK
ncbi:MAG: lamin tail domain-containing protein, partial [Planctomycetota bacterium]